MELKTVRGNVYLRDLLSLTSIEHPCVDEVWAHDRGLDAVFPCRQQLQAH